MSAVAHVVLLTSLLLLVYAALQQAADIQDYLAREAARAGAAEVAHYVSKSITSLTVAASRSRSDNLELVKLLNLPPVVLGHPYSIELVEDNGSYIVRVEVWLQPPVTAISEIPLANSSNIVVELGSGELQTSTAVIRYGPKFAYGYNSLAAWLVKENSFVRIGLGVVKQ